MIRVLRKRHLQVWMLLAILLPLGMISAWLAVPQPIKDHLFQPGLTNALPVILKTVPTDLYRVSIRSNQDRSELQLEWMTNAALTSPSALIYEIPNVNSAIGLDKVELIGRIDSRGLYHFPLKKGSRDSDLHFVVYDIIHHQVIAKINF